MLIQHIHILDPDLTEYGFKQGENIKFNYSQLELIICSPLTRTIQTYFSLFNNTQILQTIPFQLDSDLQMRIIININIFIFKFFNKIFILGNWFKFS